MKVEFFCVCDAANESHGRLNLMGIFDKIVATSLPAVHIQMSVVARLRHQESVESQRLVVLSIWPPGSDKPIKTAELRGMFKKAGFEGWSVTQLIFVVQHLTLTVAGEYEVRLSIDDKQVAMTPLFVHCTS